MTTSWLKPVHQKTPTLSETNKKNCYLRIRAIEYKDFEKESYIFYLKVLLNKELPNKITENFKLQQKEVSIIFLYFRYIIISKVVFTSVFLAFSPVSFKSL